MEGIGAKASGGQIQEGLACPIQETGTLLLVMNYKCLREKVQSEGTFNLRGALFHL